MMIFTENDGEIPALSDKNIEDKYSTDLDKNSEQHEKALKQFRDERVETLKKISESGTPVEVKLTPSELSVIETRAREAVSGEGTSSASLTGTSEGGTTETAYEELLRRMGVDPATVPGGTPPPPGPPGGSGSGSGSGSGGGPGGGGPKPGSGPGPGGGPKPRGKKKIVPKYDPVTKKLSKEYIRSLVESAAIPVDTAPSRKSIKQWQDAWNKYTKHYESLGHSNLEARHIASYYAAKGYVSDPADIKTLPFFIYEGRLITVLNIGGFHMPFYVSTGKGGKKDVEKHKWYPFWGHGSRGWLNKTKGADINTYYGSTEL
jgi:hypothetical protein